MKSLLEYYKTEIGDKLQKARKSVDLEGKGKKKKEAARKRRIGQLEDRRNVPEKTQRVGLRRI